MGILNRLSLGLRSRKSDSNRELRPLEHRLHYKFKNQSLLETALTHGSLNHESKNNYERMEFLGDAIIDEVLASWLYLKYPDTSEGFLTKRRSALVNKRFLFRMAEYLTLPDYIKVDPSVNMHERKVSLNIIGDVYESVVGAIYLDGGPKSSRKFIHYSLISRYSEANYNSNYKGTLIELCHRKHYRGPSFKVDSVSGPDHRKTYHISVIINDDMEFIGSGENKKDAEQNAAKKALDTFN